LANALPGLEIGRLHLPRRAASGRWLLGANERRNRDDKRERGDDDAWPSNWSE
jgi:hypothetical protein